MFPGDFNGFKYVLGSPRGGMYRSGQVIFVFLVFLFCKTIFLMLQVLIVTVENQKLMNMYSTTVHQKLVGNVIIFFHFIKRDCLRNSLLTKIRILNFLTDFDNFYNFVQFFTNFYAFLHKFLRIIRISTNFYKILNFPRFFQLRIYTNLNKFVEISTNFYKFLQISTSFYDHSYKLSTID